jgi:hypothetical protein
VGFCTWADFTGTGTPTAGGGWVCSCTVAGPTGTAVDGC